MKYMTSVTVLFLLMLPAFGGVASADKVFYVQMDKAGDAGSSLVLELDMKTATSKTAVANTSLPVELKGAVESAVPSPSGRYLLLKGLPWHSFRSKETGEVRTSYGYAWWSDSSKEDMVGEGSGGYWVWDRTTKTAEFLMKDSITDNSEPSWSPYNDDILIHDSTDFWPQESKAAYVEVVRLPQIKRLKFGPFSNVLSTTWSGDGKGVLVATRVGKVAKIYVQPPAGKQRLLFTWPRPILQIVQSPKGSSYAVSDDNGIYITDRNGAHARKLAIKLEESGFYPRMMFNQSGSKLAIFTHYNYGEPHVNNDYTLYVIDAATRRMMKPWKWHASFQGGRMEFARYLDGWMRDNKILRIGAQVWYGVEKPADSQHDWIKIWTIDTSKTGSREVQVFDSGKNCLSASWWSGK